MNRTKLEPIQPRSEDTRLRLEHVALDPDKRDEFRAAALATAQAGVEAFPERLKIIKTTLTRARPSSALAAFSAYGMLTGVAKSGQSKPALSDVLQHHCELLQAIVLSLPFERWSLNPVTPEIMQTLFDSVPELSNTFYLQRMLDGVAEMDDETRTARSLQEKIRMHTHGVRNWGYFDHVVGLSRDLYSPLDAAFTDHHGFSASDVINALAAIVAEFETRQSAHWTLLRRVAKGKTPRDIFETYYKLSPGLVGTAKDLLALLPRDAPREHAIAMVMAHCDLRLEDHATFTAPSLAKLADLQERAATALLDALSLPPGALEEAQPHHLFLDNPVWERPAIALGQDYLFPTPTAAFSHIHRVMERLVRDAGQEQALKDRRATFLESQLETVFRSALPNAEVRPAARWRRDGQQFETDLIVVIDRVVVIAEAKSHRLTPQGLRGAPERIKRHIREMVVDPSIQSARLEKLINDARQGDETARSITAAIGVDYERADRIIRLSVTLDDFSVLSAAEKDFKRLGWTPADHQLAPSMLITDLRCIAEILDNELCFLHYLSERNHLQKEQNLLGDELDFLGLYLTTGFSLPEFDSAITGFAATGMSSPIDAYFQAQPKIIPQRKPSLDIRPYFRSILDAIIKAKPPGWTLIGLHLLSGAAPGDQKAIERNLTKLRSAVRRNHHDPGHECTLVFLPRETRKAALAFFLFPEERRTGAREVVEKIFAENIDAIGRDAFLILSRSTEQWGRPFDSIQLFER